jgi:hypothetical protein
MPWGPVPSGCLDLINGNVETDEPFECLRVENERISLTAKGTAIPGDLSPEEREVLDETIAKYKDVPTWTLVRMTHAFPEYRETYEDGTSTTIPYDLILKLHAPGRHRNNRPVISPAMAANMISPFARSEPDL